MPCSCKLGHFPSFQYSYHSYTEKISTQLTTLNRATTRFLIHQILHHQLRGHTGKEPGQLTADPSKPERHGVSTATGT